MERVTLYETKEMNINTLNKNKLLATEMNFWRRSLGVSILQRRRNIRMEMRIERDIAEEIER